MTHPAPQRPPGTPRPPERFPGGARERGSVTLFVVLLVPCALLLIGGFVDLSRLLAARGQAADLAGQAARAGANAISQTSLRTPGQVDLRIDPAAATATANRYLKLAGATGTVKVTGDDTVTVTARIPARAAVLSIIGINDISGTATASASALHGVTTGKP